MADAANGGPADKTPADSVLLERRQHAAAWLTLNRPARRNALTEELVTALTEGLRRAGDDASVRVVVVSGSGGAFCAGADLRDLSSREDLLAELDAGFDRYHQLIRTVVQLDKPVVAMIDGPAVGFGCDLALACDMRVMSERAYLQEIFVHIGLMPDGGGTLWLPRLIGVGPALEAMMLGDPIHGLRAHELGLAQRVVSAEELQQTTVELVARLAAGPPLALAAIKRAVREQGAQLDAALAIERQGQRQLMASEDFREGVVAWMERRAPSFKGR